MSTRYLPVRVVRADLEATAAASGIHPELLRRFVELGLVPAHTDSAGRLWFPISTPARVRTILRLRSDLSLNYAGIALVLDLLARINTLENQRTIRLEGDSSWT